MSRALSVCADVMGDFNCGVWFFGTRYLHRLRDKLHDVWVLDLSCHLQGCVVLSTEIIAIEFKMR
jgi:hypothetical protein